MREDVKIVPSEELAYWVGVAQSDGCLTKYLIKRKYADRKENRVELSLDVCSKSLPMLEKFRDSSKRIFSRDSQLWKTKRGYWKFHISVKSLLPLFSKLGIILTSALFIPPTWAIKEAKFFGAYLAGLIDGDGDIVVKRPQYPQCAITINSGVLQDLLAKSITKILSCSVHQSKYHKMSIMKSSGRTIEGTWYRLEFYASSKTAKFLLDFVIPHLQLTYKKEKLYEFLNIRHMPN